MPARVFITEFVTVGGTGNYPIAGAMYPEVANQFMTASGSSQQSAAFGANTRFIRVNCDTAISIEIGANPTATTTTARMAANQTEYFSVPFGKSFKIAVIDNT